jgi:hypothetical protein
MKNYSQQTPENKFENTVSELVRKVEELRTNQISTLVIPKLTADPSSPVNGTIWINTTSNQLKVRMAGVTKVVTVT